MYAKLPNNALKIIDEKPNTWKLIFVSLILQPWFLIQYSSVMYSGPESSLASGGVNNGTVVNSGTVTTQIIGGGHAQPISGVTSLSGSQIH